MHRVEQRGREDDLRRETVVDGCILRSEVSGVNASEDPGATAPSAGFHSERRASPRPNLDSHSTRQPVAPDISACRLRCVAGLPRTWAPPCVDRITHGETGLVPSRREA